MIYLTNRVLLNELLGFGKRNEAPIVNTSNQAQTLRQGEEIRRLENKFNNDLASARKAANAKMKEIDKRYSNAVRARNISNEEALRMKDEANRLKQAEIAKLQKLEQNFKRRIELSKMDFKQKMGEYRKTITKNVRVRYKLARRGVRKFFKR